MHQLEVPLALAGPQVDADDAFREQVVARPMTAVVVRRRGLDRQVDETEILVDRNLRPDAVVAVDRPRVLLPRVVAEIAGQRNRVEGPQQLAGADVEPAHQPLGVVVRADGRTFAERRADDDDVLGDRGRGMPADLAGLQIDLLARAEHDAALQIDDAIFAERGDRRAVVRVQRDEAIAGRDVEDAVVAAPIAPIGKPAARQLARRDAGAFSFAQAVRPQQLARLAVERDHRAARAAGGVEHAVDRERRAFQLVLGARPEDVGLETPRDLERIEVGGVDLIERRVFGAADVRGVMRPVARGRGGRARGAAAILAGDARGRRKQRRRQIQEPRSARHVPSSWPGGHAGPRDENRGLS